MTDIEDLHFLCHPTVRNHGQVRPTKVAAKNGEEWKRGVNRNKGALKGEFTGNFELENYDHINNEAQAMQEAMRCLKCADAPCQKACPTSIDIRQFISCIANQNYYGAAQVILNDNPNGFSCGMLCTTSELCSGCCNLAHTPQGAINIGGLQEFAMRKFREMKIPLLKSKPAAETSVMEKPIAIIGAGVASLSCATYLARYGYTNIHVYEKDARPGGISISEIPQFRIPDDVVEFEANLVKAQGVTFHFNKALGSDGLTVSSLLNKGTGAIFVGAGCTKPIRPGVFDNLTPEKGYFTSKQMLLGVSEFSKPSFECKERDPLLNFEGKRVLVLGAGDVAMDCSRSSLRCGANHVTVVMRRNTSDVRAVEEELTKVRNDKVDILPYATALKVETGDDGKITHIVLQQRHLTPQGGYANSMVTDSEPAVTRIACDVIITAFGSKPADEIKVLDNVKVDDSGYIQVNDWGQSVSEGRVFAGGDVIGHGMTVQATNDGKIAAAAMHALLSTGKIPDDDTPTTVPGFHTVVDEVDLSVTVCGVKFPNPFGLASAPPATSIPMIARAFEMGWGFAVTKTFTADEDEVTNVTPRIMSSVQGKMKAQHYQNGFMNIELISEKRAGYWCAGIKQLKKDFPEHVVVASIMESYDCEKWQALVRQAQEAGADMIEMNLSCPHGMHEKGMGLALGTYPDKVYEACKWVVDAATIPVFAKLTPNVTDITTIAEAAVKAGVSGVTAINTVSGWVGFHADGTPYRAGVGKAKNSTFGGLSGNSIRPLALRAILAIHQKWPDLAIMATGGIDSGDVAMQMMYAGAPLMQVCSAVMNQDFSVIQDYLSALKFQLYSKARPDFATMDGQLIPAKAIKDAADATLSFGEAEIQQHLSKTNKPCTRVTIDDVVEVPMDQVPSIEQIIGFGKHHQVTHTELSRGEQLLLVVNDDLCVNCGKCYLTCNDNGYQAISFDPDTHKPHINEDDCTGCGLCESICPIPHCITFVERTGIKAACRGVE